MLFYLFVSAFMSKPIAAFDYLHRWLNRRCSHLYFSYHFFFINSLCRNYKNSRGTSTHKSFQLNRYTEQTLEFHITHISWRLNSDSFIISIFPPILTFLKWCYVSIRYIQTYSSTVNRLYKKKAICIQKA